MTDFLNSLKADLTDRRLLPVVGLVCVALIAALAYAVLGGGSSTTAPATSASTAPTTSTTPGGISVSSSTPDTAVAETTDGASEQHGGQARDPFTEFATAHKASSSTGSSSSSSSAGSSTGGSSSSSSSGTGSTGGSTPAKKTKPKPVYAVIVKFGPATPGEPLETSKLPEIEALKLEQALPSAKEALVVFRGVTNKGKAATFTLVGETILHGDGACLPNETQCQAVDLAPAHAETLEYLKPDGETVAYGLEVVSITKLAATTASAASRGWAESSAGASLLRHDHLTGLPYLRYSTEPGELVFAWKEGFASRAHGARRSH